ncbi:MAG: hypothetical protein ACRDUY_07400 [Nitriliruptorales bacterium]
MAPRVYSARERPVAVPGDLDELAGPKQKGVVSLPQHIDWSRRRTYDLDDRADRCRLYEQVIREGTLEDLRRYIDVEHLVGPFGTSCTCPRTSSALGPRLLAERSGS